MPNPNNAFGLRAVRQLDGSPCSGSLIPAIVPASDSTALFIGDPVQIAGSSSNGTPTVTRATAAGGNYIWGVVEGFDIDANIRTNGYRLASTLATVLVRPVHNMLFEIQEDSVGGDVAATDVGLNIDLVAAAGSAVTRKSGFLADTSTKATTNTLQLRIEGIVNDGLNEIGAAAPAYQRLLVSVNLQQNRNLTGI